MGVEAVHVRVVVRRDLRACVRVCVCVCVRRPARTWRHSQERVSQTRMEPSHEPLSSTKGSSVFHTSARTLFVCPARVRACVRVSLAPRLRARARRPPSSTRLSPVVAFHTRIVVSSEPDAIWLGTSGDHTTLNTRFVWPCVTARHARARERRVP